MRQTLLPAATAALLLACSGGALAQAYPGKLVRIVVGFAPGGTADIIARDFANRMQRTWGQSVIVDNRPGGNGVVATQALVKSPPDGHTLMVTISSHIINGLMVRNIGYDTLKDITPIGLIAASPLVLVKHP